jgi:hypothetical protein
MAAINATEFSINAGGDIRTSASPQIHTVLELHEWLQSMADDANSTGDDTVSILTANPSKLDGPRSAIKPMLLNLLSTFNIDATAAQYFKFGSISQNSGADLYTGVKSIGSPLVAGSPIYIVQNAAKLTTYWPDGHIQILVKAITAGTPIDSGDIRVYSRKYGQTYGDFAANLIAGGEQPAAISTATTDWTPLNLAGALALSAKVAITVGSHNKDTGDGNGSKEYKGTITLSSGCTIAEAAQYCQAICDESSTTTVDGVLGWKFRSLGDGAYGYTPNGAAPFGTVAGGKWFVAQGWYIAGALAGDLQKYQMISHDGTTVGNPVVAGISIGGLTVGARLLVGRDSGTGFVTSEYTLNGATTSGGNTCVMNEVIKTDTPDTGYLRVNGVPYLYTAINRGTKTFTISGTWGQIHASASPAWCPFIDKVVASTTEASTNYTYASDFTARLKVRKGATGGSLQAFETTFACTTSATNGTNAIATADE